jgi:hypothetical protein
MTLSVSSCDFLPLNQWRRYKILYERNGHDDVVTQLCHLVTETIVFDTEALPKQLEWLIL